MAWIELHQTLPRHPKLIRLAAKLRVTKAQAAGHLTFLWLWTLDYAPSGDLSAFGPAEISAAADFGGDAEQFAAALLEAGWLDTGMMVHDWHEYAGRLLVNRDKAKDRMREFRERSKLVTRNVRVTCDERSELPNSTVPNSTEQNQCSTAPPETVKVMRRDLARAVLDHLNKRALKSYRETDVNLSLISARLAEVKDDIAGVKVMLDRMTAMWKGGKMDQYLRPKTLFSKENFGGYYDERTQPLPQQQLSPWARKQEILKALEKHPGDQLHPSNSRRQVTEEERNEFLALKRELKSLS